MNAPAPEPWTPSLAVRIDQVCLAFETAWQRGDRPRLEEYVAQLAEPDRIARRPDAIEPRVRSGHRLGGRLTVDPHRGPRAPAWDPDMEREPRGSRGSHAEGDRVRFGVSGVLLDPHGRAVVEFECGGRGHELIDEQAAPTLGVEGPGQ